jgi:glutamate racemase
MKVAKPVFIADTCIGGLSVVKSMWGSGYAGDAIFMADYEINPLGVKSDSAITDVVNKWLRLAAENSETLVIACNTLSIRYQQLFQSELPLSGLKQVVTMVDCFTAMVNIEADRLANRKILIIGTEFTANQGLYPQIVHAALPGTAVETVAATELEQCIARFQQWESGDNSVLTHDLRQALEDTDIAVMACTCFPMARTELETQFPEVSFLDPGRYCSSLLKEKSASQKKNLSVSVTGDIVTARNVTKFARTYLENESIRSL